KVVNADINEKNDVILISLPSLGWKLKKNVIKQLIIKMALTISESDNDSNNKRSPSFINIFPRNYKSVRLKIKVTDSFHTRFILGSKIKGYLCIITRMSIIYNIIIMY